MSRFSRINTIWRKELIDTLRDVRTVVAMVLVPIVLYPVLMLGSLQAIEAQFGIMLHEVYDVAVPDDATRDWLARVLDTDPARRARLAEAQPDTRPAEEISTAPPTAPAYAPDSGEHGPGATPPALAGKVRSAPPEYRIFVDPDVQEAVISGRRHVGLILNGPPPRIDIDQRTAVQLVWDESDVRSSIATEGLQGVLQRFADRMVLERLRRYDLPLEFIQPLTLEQDNVATPEKMSGSVLGRIVPLILILMTIVGALYPAIDLTAGERERGTLETLMVAPVPTIDLVAGKFVVVTLIGMLSAALNLLSVGGTIWLGGLGDLLTGGSQLALPLWSLPWVFVLLLPMALMFGAILLAVCSFARSFKEAQNYVMPVIIAGLIPAVVGILPGTRLEGPFLVMPVANIVILTREMFVGHIDYIAIAIVVLSTCLYAGAAVAVAARLFGQEAVLFADAGSVKTIFQRRFFTPAACPSPASAMLLAAIIFPLNFMVQQRVLQAPGIVGTFNFFVATAAIIVVMFALAPLLTALYTRVRVPTAFALRRPPALAIVAALLIGSGSWVLADAWFQFQEQYLPMIPEMQAQYAEIQRWLAEGNLWLVILLLAAVPAVCEELFFRGFVISGLRGTLGALGAVVVAALMFAVFHQSINRLVVTAVLGLVFGLLVVRSGSIWPAMIAHLLHNAILVSRGHPAGPAKWLTDAGYPDGAMPPLPWLLGAAALVVAGIAAASFVRPPRSSADSPAAAPAAVAPTS